LFVFPGTIAPALIGGAMVFGALVWMMLDIWPNEPIAFRGGELVTPLITVMAGISGAIILFFAFLKFIPGNGPWGRMVLKTAVGGVPTGVRTLNTQESSSPQDLIGQSGVACTGLFPSGQIEIAGKRYEAKLQMGHADPGAAVIITGVSQFGLIVEVKS
jgi:membrane-bound serine protease (ClpP class)